MREKMKGSSVAPILEFYQLKITDNIYTDQQHKSPTDGENGQYSVGVENPALNPGIHVNIIRPINPS